MRNVVTLIAAPNHAVLDDSVTASASSCLTRLGGLTDAPDWLAPGIACDIAFRGIEPVIAEAALRQALGAVAVDIAVQSAGNRRRSLLIADMDSTIVAGETLDELADFAGLKDRIAAITARAMNGEIDFAAALRERVGLLRGLSVAALEQTLERLRLNPGAETLVRTMRTNGAYTALVSGGFDIFTGAVARSVGFDLNLANRLDIADGSLTGRVIEPILDRDSKLEALQRLTGALRLSPSDTLAVGDGANDLPMIRAAGLGVAFRAKPVVAAQARVRIDHGDLTGLLYLQGYRREQFVDNGSAP